MDWQVLLENLVDLERALEFAEKVNAPEVWSTMARAQLGAGEVSSAIASFLKAGDITAHEEVVQAAKVADCYQDLVSYLQMVPT